MKNLLKNVFVQLKFLLFATIFFGWSTYVFAETIHEDWNGLWIGEGQVGDFPDFGNFSLGDDYVLISSHSAEEFNVRGQTHYQKKRYGDLGGQGRVIAKKLDVVGAHCRVTFEKFQEHEYPSNKDYLLAKSYSDCGSSYAQFNGKYWRFKNLTRVGGSSSNINEDELMLWEEELKNITPAFRYFGEEGCNEYMASLMKIAKDYSRPMNPAIYWALGREYDKGPCVNRKHEKLNGWELSLYESAASKGYLPAIMDLVSIYQEGSPNVDLRKWIEMVQKGADKGDVWAKYKLANAYLNGDGVLQNFEKHKELLVDVAADGFTQAQLDVGKMYEYGMGAFSKSYKNAYLWYAFADYNDKRHAGWSHATKPRDKVLAQLKKDDALEVQEALQRCINKGQSPTCLLLEDLEYSGRGPRF